MRRGRRDRRWQRRAAAFLTVILFTAGGGFVLGQESEVGQSLLAAVRERVFFDAVCAVSPLVGYLLRSRGGRGRYPYSEEALQNEMEALLLAEQQGGAAAGA